jgi:hypothetical protein
MRSPRSDIKVISINWELTIELRMDRTRSVVTVGVDGLFIQFVYPHCRPPGLFFLAQRAMD